MNLIKKTSFKIADFFLLSLTALFIFFPILWILLTAFKNTVDAYSTKIFFAPTLKNFITVFSQPLNFAPLLMNTVIISFFTVLTAVPIAFFAAYALSRFQYRFKNALVVWILSTQFFPPVVLVMPFFILYRNIGLIDTRTALVLINLSFCMPFSIWMLKGFIDSLTPSMEEAALVEGCNFRQVMIRIVFPLTLPGIITASIFAFIQGWNQYLFALILTKEKAVTLMVGMGNLYSAERGFYWEQAAAIGIIVMLPIFVFSYFVKNYFTQGITMGAVK